MTTPIPSPLTAVYALDEDRSTWLVHLAEEERCHTFGRTFARARAAIREAAALWYDVDDDAIEVHDVLPGPEGEAVEELSRLRAAVQVAQVEAAASAAVVVARLGALGLTERDIGRLVGLSHQRIHQMRTAAT